MSQCFLGIDGGGTKTLGRIGGPGVEPLELRAGPSSLTQDIEGAIGNVMGLCRDLLMRSGIQSAETHLVCGVAGAGNPSAAAKLTARLESLGFASVTVTSDARTSLIGAGAGSPLVMAAIGTGSVVMRLASDGDIRQFGGWGLAVGDEGSGAAIGKSAVRALLWELDIYGGPRTPLCQQIMAEVGQHRGPILSWLQSAGSREYGGLAPVVFSHLPACDLAREIVTNTTAEVERLIRAASAAEALPLALLGGLADKLVPYLSPDLQERLIPPLGTALDGACILARNDSRVATVPYS
ncbi:Glucosamine kinase GspK [Microbulbifer aggregans]|uniref:Glucosamine kinase GspK n=1 Tax=Microbulbifer aggregans TaxID=1769779 RepID=A0A1C9WAM3_9GAMM|nr:BadF/BadG/BcrA/BcrD ATPase family protein [Microbulbifer aggregans]AOS98200.1 Glucosamine kinase GspK [Microbulbifer aggregans]